MPAETVALRTAQLIYTNVEADESPTGRRGFQVWLHTPGLGEPLRREIGKRLGDFKLPAGVRDPDALRRHLYFSADDEGGRVWILAHTAPLSEKDMFGRGGRFYAHAFIITEPEFSKIGFDPFTLLDAPIRFQLTPAEGKAAASRWREGIIEETVWHVALPSPTTAPPPLLREMVAFLETSDYQPLAVPDSSEAMLAWLRGLFRWLPPDLRAEGSFDTLSTGQSLSTVPYRFAGALSVDQFRRWTYRRTGRLDPASNKLTPTIEVRSSYFDELLSQWMSQGTRPADLLIGRIRSWLRALGDGNLASLAPEGLSPEAIKDLRAIPPLRDQMAQLREQRLLQDLTVDSVRSLVRESALIYLQPNDPVEELRRLATPLPHPEVITWLYASLTAMPTPILKPEQAAAISSWVGDDPSPQARRCKLIALRWHGASDRIASFMAKAPSNEAAWLAQWCRQTLEVSFRGPGELALRVRDALDRSDGDESILGEAELFLAIPDRADSEESAFDRHVMQLLIAFHRQNASEMEALLGAPDGTDLRSFLLDRFERADASIEFRAAGHDGEYHLGIDVRFRGREARRLATAASVDFEIAPRRSLRFWNGLAGRDLPALIEGRISAPNNSPTWIELLQLMKRERWDVVAHELRQVNDTIFQDFAEPLAGKFAGTPTFQRMSENSFWVGVRTALLDPKNKVRDRSFLGAVVSATTPIWDLDDWSQLLSARTEQPTDRHRACWLLKFLSDPLLMCKYTINRH